MKRTSLVASLTLVSLLLACAHVRAFAQAGVENAFPNLTFNKTTDVQEPGDGTDRMFVVGQEGKVWVFQNDADVSQKTTFLDLRSSVECCGEKGLLGLAFHPNHASNGYFFVNYTTNVNGSLHTRISRFQVSDSNPDEADPNSEVVLLEVEQPKNNHNAGQLQFGSDGYLYVGLGDGGGSGDPGENGQDPTTLLGSMLRLDVDGGGNAPDCGGSGASYTIPPGNPFVDDGDSKCDEIYAYGFRNPFRFSFGPNGKLWVADVGQNDWEEIDWVESGKNYGWNTMEGAHCFDPPSGCDQTGLELPVHEYSHNVGFSITGGYVYEGSCSPINGNYIYGDFVTGSIWAIEYDDTAVTSNTLLIDGSGLNIPTFGIGPDDRLLIADRSNSGALYTFKCSTLPVELTTFDAVAEGTAVRLEWRTASETNNAGFEVQHATEGTFERIEFVKGAGTTSEPRRYSYEVEDLAFGDHRFRLKQIDFDGTSEYSPEVEVTVELNRPYQISEAYPNPFTNETQIDVAVQKTQTVQVTLYDMLGRRVALLFSGELRRDATKKIPVEGDRLSSGLYFIQIQGETFEAVRRIVYQR